MSSFNLSWYKLASINPWSIFEEVPREGDSDSAIQIHEGRLGEFVSDVTYDRLYFVGAFITNVNSATFDVSISGDTTDLVQNVHKVMSSLGSVSLFSNIQAVKINSHTYSVILKTNHKFKPCELDL
jgi:hypothetical protein